MKQQRRRDVVGQVADDAQITTARSGECCEIETQCITLVQREAARHERRAQLGGEIAIDFDRIE